MFRVLIYCDCDETDLFQLIITCTGLLLACFVILFVYMTILISAVAFEWLATIAFKVICNFVPQGNAWLWLSVCFFWRTKNLDFLYFAVSLPCFNRLRLCWNCAFWIDDNMHWALIGLFCDTLFVYMTILISAVAFEWLATIAFKVICNFVPQGNAWLWLSVCFFGDLKF